VIAADVINIEIVLSPYAPSPIQLRFPRKGPYWQRRQKRMRADARNWSKPDFWMVRNKIICHPSVWPTIKKALEEIKEIPG
jgi:hypothetical protein